jgi:hypothetical protein
MILVLFSSCELNNTNEVIPLSSEFKANDLTVKKIEVYQINKELVPLIDSIIDLIISCPNHSNHQISFIYTSFYEAPNYHLSIEVLRNPIYFDYSICEGVFYYKGYQFGVIGESRFLEKINDSIQVVGLSFDKMKKLKFDDEFSESSWQFVFIDNQNYCISFINCNEYWYDENYYHAE